jgi:DNA-binding SARP family transcriptional activator/tetratricopeptide (TPR) repeat protein
VEFRILGPLEAREGGRPVALGGRKQRALLAILLLHANEVVSRDRLIDSLWGDVPPKSAADIVRVFVSRLRKALEPRVGGNGAYRVLQTWPAGYLLAVEPDQLDVRRFESRLTEAGHARTEGNPVAAAELLREALTLWRGPPLSDFTYEPFAQGEIAHLEELRLAAVEERIDADLACGRHDDLVVELESLIREEPGRERLRGQLMLALYRSGRQAEALGVYRQTRETLVEELGIEPTPGLRELEAAILRQDRSLDSPSVPRPTAVRAETRKTVTVVGSSLTATGHEGQRLDPEAWRRLRRSWRDEVARAARKHGGLADGVLGEAAIAAFGVPIAHEDDAIRALRAADELRKALPSSGGHTTGGPGARIEAGIGVASEEVIVGGSADTALVDGEVVDMSIHLAELAGPSEVIMDDATRRRAGKGIDIELLPPLTVKGRREPVTVWRLVELSGKPSPVVPRPDAPMLGRDYELEKLRHSLRQISADARAEIVTVVGEPGIGKSRLAHELARAVRGDARVVVGRCLAYGEGITFWPLREIVAAAAGGLSVDRLGELLREEDDAEAVVAAVRGALGLAATPQRSEETFWAFRRLFEALARGTALVAVFEDVHWAEPTLLDLIEHLAHSLTRTPVLIVCLARPELLEERPNWGGGESAARIQLEPLSDAESEALITELAGGSFPHRGDAAQIAERAEGNPLFVEQILAMIEETKTVDVEQAIPPTIHALLAARLDRLGPGERAVVERAAVVGREFAEDVVIDLLPPDARPHGARHVDALVRKQFVGRDEQAGRERRLRFRHVLIQDVAYRSIPKELRADLHERIGTRLERRTKADAVDEIIGYHLEHAFGYRAELGNHDRKLARRAAWFLVASGRRALLTGDAPAAVNLLMRATMLMPQEDPVTLALLLDLAEALTQAGELGQADEVLAKTAKAAKAADDRAAELRANVARAPLRMRLGDPAATRRRVVRAAISELERLGDRAGLVKAWRALGELESTRARARAAFTHALRHAEGIGDERQQAELRIAIGKTLIFDATPVDEAIRAIEHNLEWARSKGFRKAEGECLGGLAHLYAMGGDFTRARALSARQKAIFEDLGQRFMAARFAFAIGSVEILAKNLAAAEREFRAGYELFAGMGEQAQSLTFAAMISRVVYDQGRYEEADLWAETAAAPNMTSSVRARPCFSKAVHAKVLARAGEFERAEALARAALDDHKGSDEIEEEAVMLMDLAEILALADRPGDAVAAVEEATRLYDRKGHLVSARDARAFMDRLAVAQSTTGAG